MSHRLFCFECSPRLNRKQCHHVFFVFLMLSEPESQRVHRCLFESVLFISSKSQAVSTSLFSFHRKQQKVVVRKLSARLLSLLKEQETTVTSDILDPFTYVYIYICIYIYNYTHACTSL